MLGTGTTRPLRAVREDALHMGRGSNGRNATAGDYHWSPDAAPTVHAAWHLILVRRGPAPSDFERWRWRLLAGRPPERLSKRGCLGMRDLDHIYSRPGLLKMPNCERLLLSRHSM
jgi:hypothetical protein